MAEAAIAEHTPLARILEHENQYWTTIAQAEQREGFMLFHNRDLIPRIDPNHAGHFRAPAGSGPQIVRAIVSFYETLGATPAVYLDVLATPGDLIDHLLAAGFHEWASGASDLMLYTGPDQERPASVEVAIAATADERSEWATIMEEDASGPRSELLHRLYLRECSDPRITPYLARVDGAPAARGELFSSAGLGRVEAIRTAEAYRRRGLAAAIVRKAVYDSLAQNELTYIYAEPGGEAQRLYHRLGFRTVINNAIRLFIR